MKKPTPINLPKAKYLWPINCHSVDVIATANIGMTSLTQVSAVGVAVAKTSAQPQQSFSDSLSTASRAHSESESANDRNTKTARRQKSASEKEQTASMVHRDDAAQSSALPQQMVQPAQDLAAQQSQGITSDAASLPLSFAGAVATAYTPSQQAAQPAGVDSNTVQSGNDPSQATSIQPGSGTQNIDASGTSPFETGNSALTADANAAAGTSSNAVQSLDQSGTANTVQNVVPSADSDSLPEAISAPVYHAALSASTSAILASTVGDTSTNLALPSTTVSDQALLAAGLGVSGRTANQPFTHVASGNGVSTDATGETAKPKQLLQIAANRVGSQTYSQQNSTTGDESQSAVTAQKHNGNLPDSNISTIQASGVLAGTVHATVPSFNSAPVVNQSVARAANGKIESTDSTSAAGLNQFATDYVKPQSGSGQDAPAGDQSQNGASSHEQSTTPSQTNLATNSVVAILPAQNASTLSLVQSAPLHTGVTASVAKNSDAAAFASPTVTQASPVINTAKLIQSMGQSEMRVGMRSSEFGNISISTTVNKDTVLARISLDHGDLAKALAAQLPEMQARLGGNRPMDVRIDMSGTATGQGTGTSGNMSGGTSDQSSAGKQQSVYPASSYSDNRAVERQLYPVAAAAAAGSGSLNARLDIRV